MSELYIHAAAVINAIISLVIAVFQLLLFAGFPLGEYSWGGKHKGVLPKKLRMMSLPSAILILFMGFIFLLQANVLPVDVSFLPMRVLVWVFTIFLALNTLGNLASKSKNERLVMTPLSGIAFLSCLIVAIYSV